jgi:protein phosphatase
MNSVMTMPSTSATTQLLELQAASQSQRGETRRINQDSVYYHVGHTVTGEAGGLVILCDGMGGHEAGEVASRLAVQAIRSVLDGVIADGHKPRDTEPTQPSGARLEAAVRGAIESANRQIYEHWGPREGPATTSGRPGTTVALVLIAGHTALIAGAGDSRVYACRTGVLRQITRDHSLAAKMLETGVFRTVEEAAKQRNVIYRALGIEPAVEADLFQWPLESGDSLLLCSDGLWKAFPYDDELARILQSAANPENIVKHLVTEAVQRDGADDTSAIVVTAR